MKPGEHTVIGRGAKLRGYLSCEEDLQIDGEVEGTIRMARGKLTVSEGARVRATVGARDIVILGKVEGEIHAAGRVELRPTAVVLGDIFAAHLSIEENAVLRGNVDLARANETVPPPPAAQPAAAERAADASSAKPAQGVLGGSAPRTPDLFNPQPEGAARSSAQMPSALRTLAEAAATGQDAAAGDAAVKGARPAAEPKL